jgi:hypothetical protein
MNIKGPVVLLVAMMMIVLTMMMIVVPVTIGLMMYVVEVLVLRLNYAN